MSTLATALIVPLGYLLIGSIVAAATAWMTDELEKFEPDNPNVKEIKRLGWRGMATIATFWPGLLMYMFFHIVILKDVDRGPH